MEITYHYPPELLALLVDTIPRLVRGKQDVFIFLRGAGVADTLMGDLRTRHAQDKHSLSKFDIVRTVLTRLNEKGEVTLEERREIVRRVVEFEDFSTCWENERLKAQGLVAQIRRVVDVKDSFTRIRQQPDAERQKRSQELADRQAQQGREREKLREVRAQLGALFLETNVWRRGKRLEGVLNALFAAVDGVGIRDAFTVKGNENEGVVEQIDGAIELDGHIYLVEVKWYEGPIGVAEVSPHLVRLYSRADVRGIIVSASGFAATALAPCREALSQKVVVLCELRELVLLLEAERSVPDAFRQKVRAAAMDKNPFLRVIG